MQEIIYGPYTRSADNRKIVVVESKNKRKVVTYARYLMQEKLQRELVNNEVVDHIDGNCSNDNINNLQLLTREENAQKRVVDSPETGQKYFSFVCPVCERHNLKPLNEVKGNWKKGKSGPFSSKACAREFQLHKDKYSGRMSKSENETVLKTVGNICLMGSSPITPTN